MKIQKIFSLMLSLVLVGCLWMQVGVEAQAAETDVAVRHEYTTTEEEAIDQWYAVIRGTYLQSGICTVKRSGTAKVSVSGTTTAYSTCDKVKVGVYLDESDDGGASFGQIGSYYFSDTNTSSCHGSKTNISVTSGWYYMARAGHSVTEGTMTETTTSATDAIRAS